MTPFSNSPLSLEQMRQSCWQVPALLNTRHRNGVNTKRTWSRTTLARFIKQDARRGGELHRHQKVIPA